ncbi:HXXEE domain-containing protein [Leptospira levettii]|uniref:HXXEE domain-containing protein n=1 Tax=Leptospira levettii TaxID=2023178 RepID=UPI001EEAF1CC|nr:HXXEE domain-containing protein [Leptospira levettii]MCG6147660.1 HXXEE domain-containing protein [Leptospira levettii]
MIEFEKHSFYQKLIWLFPIAFFFHVIEESNGFPYWVTYILEGQMDVSVFYINNLMFMVVLLLLTFFAFKKQNSISTFLLFLWVSGQQFWNFVFHIYTQFQFNAYSPGYFTAIFLYFPIYMYLTYLALRDHHIEWKLWILCFVFGSLGMVFTIWSGLYHFGSVPWSKWI